MSKKWIALALVIAMMLSLAACGGSQTPKETTEPTQASEAAQTEQTPTEAQETATPTATTTQETLTIALPVEPATLDPFAHSNQNGFICTSLVLEPLIKKNDDGELIPWLATSWEYVDDTTLHFTLRDDVTFQDGSKFTAKDVKFSLTKLAQSSFTSTFFQCIDYENITVEDDYNLTVKLLYTYAPLLEALATLRAGMVSEDIYNEMGADAFARNPVGTGPMKFSRWVTGDRIEMEAYDGYWGEAPAFKKFVARVIVEASSRTIELETGGVDIAFELAAADWNRIDENPETQLISGNTQGISYLCLNNSLAPIAGNENLRKALAYGLNLEALVKAVWQGTADVADSYYSPTIMGHKTIGPREYDPEKAKELLAEAGFPDGLDVTYMTYESAVNLAFAEVLQNMWGQIGVNVSIQFLDLATFTQMNNAGEITMALMTNTASIPDPAAALIAWPTSRTISLRHGDSHIDELLQKGQQTYDEAERIGIYEELQDYLWDRTYTIPIAFPKGAYGARANVTNLPFYPDLMPDMTRVQFVG